MLRRIGNCLRHLRSGRAERAFAVCGVPDARKGERLMVLTTVPAAEVPAIVAQLQRRGLPALFVPRQEQFVAVDELPVLGTGKLDLRAVKERCLAAAATVTQAIADPT